MPSGQKSNPSGLKVFALLLLRFNLVGVGSTAIYWLTGVYLLRFTRLDTLLAHLCAFIVGILFSYLGHSVITFRQSNRAILFRFFFSTLLLFAGYSILSLVLYSFSFPKDLGFYVIGVFYPISSFLVHKMWTFRKP
jgi:putative flippase GtrA